MANLDLVWTQPVLIKVDRDIEITTFTIALTFDYSFKISSTQTLSISDLSNVNVTFRSAEHDILVIDTSNVDLSDKTTGIDTYFNTVLGDFTNNYWVNDTNPTDVSNNVIVTFGPLSHLPELDSAHPVDNAPSIFETIIVRKLAQQRDASGNYDASGSVYNNTALTTAEKNIATNLIHAMNTQDTWKDSLDTFHTATGAGYYFKEALKGSSASGEVGSDISNNPVADLISQVHNDASGAERINAALDTAGDVDSPIRLDQILAAGDSLFVVLAITGQSPTSDLNIYIDGESASNNTLACTAAVDESLTQFSNTKHLNDLIDIAAAGAYTLDATSRVPPISLRLRITLGA